MKENDSPFFSHNVDSNSFGSSDVYFDDMSKIFHNEFQGHAADGDVSKEIRVQFNNMILKHSIQVDLEANQHLKYSLFNKFSKLCHCSFYRNIGFSFKEV